MEQGRLNQIEATAIEMAAEIEWMDFPSSPACGWRELMTDMAQHPVFQETMREMVRSTCHLLRQRPSLVEGLPGHQEVELEAVGILQAAAKQVLLAVHPAMTIMRDEPLLMKVRRIPNPLLQAPRNMRVPSMKEQLEGRVN